MTDIYDCWNQCLTESNCRAFVHVQDSGHCLLYTNCSGLKSKQLSITYFRTGYPYHLCFPGGGECSSAVNESIESCLSIQVENKELGIGSCKILNNPCKFKENSSDILENFCYGKINILNYETSQLSSTSDILTDNKSDTCIKSKLAPKSLVIPWPTANTNKKTSKIDIYGKNLNCFQNSTLQANQLITYVPVDHFFRPTQYGNFKKCNLLKYSKINCKFECNCMNNHCQRILINFYDNNEKLEICEIGIEV